MGVYSYDHCRGQSRIVWYSVNESRQGGSGFGQFGGIVTNGSYLAWQGKATTIDAIGAWADNEFTLTGLGRAERVRSAGVSPSLFDVLRAAPLLGRRFLDSDTPEGAGRVVLVSHAFWQQRLEGRRDVLGLALRLDGEPFTVVGVMGADFTFPNRETAIWLPFHVPPTVTPGSRNGNIKMFSAMARLKPAATVAQATAEASARAQAAPNADPVAIAVFGSDGPAQMTLVPALDDATRDVRPALLVLLAAVGLLLAASVANVANLQLARAASRRRELAIRSALGASSGLLARQLMVETLVLGLAGGVGGLLLAAVAARAMPAWLPADFPRVDQVQMDAKGALVALGAALLAGLGAGLLPRGIRGASRPARHWPKAARHRWDWAIGRTPGASARSSWRRRWPLPRCCWSARRCCRRASWRCCGPIGGSTRPGC